MSYDRSSLTRASREPSKMCQEFVHGRSRASHCGAIRQDSVVIRNPRKLDEVVFIPTDAKDVQRLTKGLTDFVNENIGKIDPVIVAGIFH